MRKAICPGSFDPVTLGHIDIFERAAKLFDEVVVLITLNADKKYLVSAEERAELIRMSTGHIKNLKVDIWYDLVSNYLEKEKISFIVKGVRNTVDYEYEGRIAYVNDNLIKGYVETILLAARPEHVYLSSTIARDVARYGGDITSFVPREITERINMLYCKENCREGE